MPIIEIKDLAAEELIPYVSSNEIQLKRYFEPELGIFIAESPKVIRLALSHGYEPISLLAERKYIEGQGKDIIDRCAEIPVYTAGSEVLTKLTGFKLTQGLLCAMRRKPLPTVAQLCACAKRIAILENVMNPTNVGAIMRSAAALNMDALLLTPACSDPLYRRAIRVSMGTVFQLPWTFYDPQTQGEELRALGFKTVAMALREDSVSLAEPRLKEEERLAIILGTEGEGLADLTIADSDDTVRIPMSHGVDSLNVASAAAVAFWELSNKE